MNPGTFQNSTGQVVQGKVKNRWDIPELNRTECPGLREINRTFLMINRSMTVQQVITCYMSNQVCTCMLFASTKKETFPPIFFLPVLNCMHQKSVLIFALKNIISRDIFSSLKIDFLTHTHTNLLKSHHSTVMYKLLMHGTANDK